MAQSQPEPRGHMVDIPRTSTYFAQAMGSRPDPDPPGRVGHITGTDPR